ncbi:MAG: MoxR family ATPase [Chthonomonadales bacterium]|nr:MoxR family ATPase [Chthonomonadales bacterium]
MEVCVHSSEQWATRTARIVDTVEQAILGKRSAVESALGALLAGGHLLIEDIPGVGKTTLAKALARSLDCEFRRIQFTPDLLPSDVTGTSVFNQRTLEFDFRPGPIFSNIVLADEVNRATPKTQAALLECMEERQVTVDGHTHELAPPFFVLATQNNIELSGTYPLPEAQLDRFIARISIGYPTYDDELGIMSSQSAGMPIDSIEPAIDAGGVLALQRAVRGIRIDISVQTYIVDLVTSTRNHPTLHLGASPRGTLALMRLSQARALIQGRDFVAPDDVKSCAVHALAHRLIVRAEHRLKGTMAQECIEDILSRTPVP